MFYLMITEKEKNAKRHIAAKGINIEYLERFGSLFAKDNYVVEIYEADIHSIEEEKALKDKWQFVKEL